MKGRLSFLLLILLTVVFPAGAEEHVIERGETALQIALDHNLTMEQLSQLNPGADLEMMIAGDILIVPDEGSGFDEFLDRHYAEMIRITDLNCEILADQSALCLFHAENISDVPLYDVFFQIAVRGQNGSSAEAPGILPLMQLLPGEKLPCAVSVPGSFDVPESCRVTVRNLTRADLQQSSFRIDPALYSRSESFLPDRLSAVTSVRFTDSAAAVYHGKHINLLAAAYDAEGTLVGVRSLYSDFLPRLDVTTYTNNRRIDHIELWMEAY